MASPRRRPPLVGLRVLECGDTLASAYAGRLLADLGADVLVVEDATGHPLRRIGPFLGGVAGPERSGAFGFFAAGKSSMVVDVGSPEAGRSLEAAAGRADVVLRSSENGHDWLDDLAVARACAANPGLIVADLSTYGRINRADDRPAGMSDLLALAAGGLLSVNSTEPSGPDASPLRYRGELASVHTAGDAVVAVLGALFERDRSGLGQRIDVSAQAAVASILATALATWSYSGVAPVHNGRRGVAPWGFYRCLDGTLLVQVTEDSQWRAFVELLGNPDWGTLELFASNAQRIEAMDVLDPLVSEAVAGRSTDELLAGCHRLGVAAARIHTAADLLAWDHLAARRFFDQVPVDVDGKRTTLTVPGVPWRYHTTARPRRGAPPQLGGHTGRAATDWAPPPPARSVAGEPARRTTVPPPLAGVRVVDLTWVWAGPYASLLLAHLGAEVVKIESAERLDVTRQLGPWADDRPGPDRSGYFNLYNQGKRSMVVDLHHPDGVAVLRGLLSDADVVIDNRRAGTLARLGFPYDSLRKLNPRIVAVSMTGFGEDGPERDRMAYGSIIDALSGVASSNGRPGGGPTDFPMSLPDPCAGFHAAIATLAALRRARRTGRGERVECSMLEASVAAFPWPVLYQGVEGRPPPVIGNWDERFAPHDVYRCRGEYEWVAIAVTDDGAFRRLAAAIGRPELAADPRFATAADRRAHVDELDILLTSWTTDRSPAEAATTLRTAGVLAEAVAHMPDVAASPVLAARHFFTRHDHPAVGVKPLPGAAWSADRSPMVVGRAAPCLGADTHAVLHEWLGLPEEEIEGLAEAGVIPAEAESQPAG